MNNISYINDKETITATSECEIDLANEKHLEIPWKVFIGWKLEDGTEIPAKVFLKSGDVLKAHYIDFDKSDFFVKEAQIKDGESPALRFIIEKNKAFYDKLPNSNEFGALILPTDKTWGRSMYLDSPIVAEWAWDEETKLNFTVKSSNGNTPLNVVCKNVFENCDNSLSYTVCVTNIDKKLYKTFYTVRGYIKYVDLNGISKVFYSDYYQASLYNTALDCTNKNGTAGEIVKYCETILKDEYLAENYDNRVNLSGYEDTADKNPNHAMYALKNGIKVREVVIDTGKAHSQPVEIVHFADTHLNFINEKDLEEGEINTLSTYRGRKWQRDGHSVENISRVMEYASFFDQTVITGDIMDYFSWGCGEIMKKMIIDRDRDAILVVGNHEPAELMQEDLPGLSYKYSLDERYQRIQSLWADGQNLFYHSKILKNKTGEDMAMLVALDNQRDKYWGIKQAIPFAADIEKARALDIPVLIFQHDPVCTNNPQDAKATFFYEPGDVGGLPPEEWFTNMMDDRFTGYDPSDFETMMVYDLIAKNYDIIKGVFCGHWNNHMYTEIVGKNLDGSFAVDENGNYKVIPQYIVTANAYKCGSLIKITVK